MTADAHLLDRAHAVDTTSLADAGRTLRVLPAALRPLRPGRRLLGRAVTARANADLMSVIAALQQAGPGDVLVVEAGSDDHAVAGELFATEALRRGVVGLVVDGLVRDTATLARLDLPVYARGAAPHAVGAGRLPEVQLPVRIGTVEVRPGELVVGDDDGLLVLTDAELADAIDGAEQIQRREVALQADVAAGTSLFDRFDFDDHLARLRAGQPSRLSFA